MCGRSYKSLVKWVIGAVLHGENGWEEKGGEMNVTEAVKNVLEKHPVFRKNN